MLYQLKNRFDAQDTAVGLQDMRDSQGRIGRLVLLCAIVLMISAALLIGTALQVMGSIDQADLDKERRRVANAIDITAEQSGPLTPASAELLGRLVGLRDAHLSTIVTTDPSRQQIPLLGRLGPSGSFLTWTRASMVQPIFVRYAPIRLPIITVMLLTVIGLLLRLRSLVADIDRQRLVAHRQSRRDVVTGLANRLAFETELDQLTSGHQPFAVILFDLDRFKHINDVFGHAAGDQVLQAVGARLSRLLAPDDLLARIGGDEFAMLMRSCHDMASLNALARDCIAVVETPIQLTTRPVRVGISFGIAASDAPHQTADELMADADMALYRAKSRRGSAFDFAGDRNPAPSHLAGLMA